MKNLFLLILISLATICSCKKQDSTAEQRLTKRKAALEAAEKALNERMDALDERVNVLDGRVNALSEKKQAATNAQTIPTQVQASIPSLPQRQTEVENTIQIPDNMPDDLKMKAERDRQQLAQTPRQQDRLESRRRKLEMLQRAVSPSAQTGSPSATPAVPPN